MNEQSAVSARPEGAEERRHSGWRKAGLLLLLCLLLPPACALSFQTLATARDARRYPPPGQLVDVGGYQMHIFCQGEQRGGAPTVVLDASYPATVSSWIWIQPQVAAVARVCAYDRAGAGWSDPSPSAPNIGQMAAELQRLLEASGEPGPYILVGHSWGGAVTRLFAASHPQQVDGLIWIEALHPDGWARRGLPESTLGGIPPSQAATIPVLARLGLFRLLPGLRGLWGIVPGLPQRQQAELTAYFNSSKWAEHIVAVEQELPTSLVQLREAGGLADIPLAIVIGAAGEEASGIGLQLQRELAALSTNSEEHRVAGADHSGLVHDVRYARQTGDVIVQMIARVQSMR